MELTIGRSGVLFYVPLGGHRTVVVGRQWDIGSYVVLVLLLSSL